MPLPFGKPATRTHDYQRHGTTSLFAALNVATGKVNSQLKRRHRSVEFLQFLKAIDATVPKDQEVHLIMDNYGTHKTEKVRAWFAERPRYHGRSKTFCLAQERRHHLDFRRSCCCHAY